MLQRKQKVQEVRQHLDRLKYEVNADFAWYIEKQFVKMMDLMAEAPTWTLRLWRTTLDEQLGSWISYIPGISSSNEMQTVKKFKGV